MDERTIAYHEAAHAVVGTFLGFKITKVSIEADDERLGFVAESIEHFKQDFDGSLTLVEQLTELVWALAEQEPPGGTASREEPDAGVWSEAVVIARELQPVLESPSFRREMSKGVNLRFAENAVVFTMAGQAAECILEERDEPDWSGGSAGDKRLIGELLWDLACHAGYARVEEATLYSPFTDSDAFCRYVWSRTLSELQNPAVWAAVEAVAAALLKSKWLPGEEVASLAREARFSYRPPAEDEAA